MGRFTKRLIVGLAAAVTVAGGAFADALLDDFEGGTNENKFGNYWYFWTNSAAARENVPGYTPPPCDKKPYGPDLSPDSAREKIVNAKTSANDFRFVFEGGYGASVTAQMAGSQFAGVLQFENLKSQWSSSHKPATQTWEDVYPGVGLGANLTSDTINGLDLSKATSVSFYMKVSESVIDKATVGGVKFRMIVTDQLAGNPNHPAWSGDLKGCIADAPYEVILKSPTTTWKKYTVNLDTATLKRDAWEVKEKPYDFNKKHALSFGWYLEGKSLAAGSKLAGLIAIDSVVINGYTFIPRDLCNGCKQPATTTAPKEDLLFSDFDKPLGGAGLNQNKLGQYWYAYDDSAARKDPSVPIPGTQSKITDGTGMDEYYTDGPSLIVDGNKAGYQASNGAYIGFTMGTPYDKKKGTETNKVQPFVGIGTNLVSDEDIAANKFFDGSELTAIWFRYKTTGFDELIVEVSDKYAVTHDDGEVFYTKLEGTGGQWAVAVVPIDKLVLPSWAEARTGTNAKLDIKNLAKIQFKNQSVGAGEGTLQIDDVYLIDPAHAGQIPGAVKLFSSKAPGASFRATYSRGMIGVNWNAASNVASGKIQLVNTKGRIMASVPLATSAGKVTSSINAGSVPTGMYFVRVNAKDVNGKNIVMQSPVSIVK